MSNKLTIVIICLLLVAVLTACTEKAKNVDGTSALPKNNEGANSPSTTPNDASPIQNEPEEMPPALPQD